LRKVRVYNAKRLEGPVDKTLEAKYSHELIVPEVVEYTRGKDIEKKINMAIGRSHIYVGIFGNRASPITEKEFYLATDRGMTTLVYFFTEPPRTLKRSKGRSAFFNFLMKEIKPRALISGNYDSILFKTRQALEDEIVSDITAEVTIIVRQYHGIQKAMTGFQM